MCETRWYLRRGKTRRARNELDDRIPSLVPRATLLRASERLSPPEYTCAGHTSYAHPDHVDWSIYEGSRRRKKLFVPCGGTQLIPLKSRKTTRRGGSAFNFAKARKDLSRFGNWHASWIRVELVKELEKRGNRVAIESTGRFGKYECNSNGDSKKKILVFTEYSWIAKINRDNPQHARNIKSLVET